LLVDEQQRSHGTDLRKLDTMDLSKAITEPFVQLIGFHNAFNRGIKVNFGAMIFLAARTKEDGSIGPIVVPTGNEPWG
jgi:hypothetical protein